MMCKNDLRINVLVRDQFSHLVAFAGHWGRDSAEDAVQEALLKLAQKDVWPENPLAWLFTVIRRGANNEVRSQKRRKIRENMVYSTPLQPEGISEENLSETNRLKTELAILDVKYREVLAAKFWDGLGFEQIADSLGISLRSTYRRYDAGLVILRNNLRNKPIPDS